MPQMGNVRRFPAGRAGLMSAGLTEGLQFFATSTKPLRLQTELLHKTPNWYKAAARLML